MSVERNIGNVVYKVQRSFCGASTAADLIKARMVAAAKTSPQNALTDSPAECYNKSSRNKSDQSNDKEAFH